MSRTAVDGLMAGSSTATGGASAQILAANPIRTGLQVVVDTAATAPVYLLLGAGTASATNWHIVLAAGGSWSGDISGFLWRGAVQAFSAAGGKIGVVEV